MDFLHSEPILIGVYVCCLWGVGKVPISTNRNTSGPQPRWLRRCTNILEIHQTRKTIRNASRKLFVPELAVTHFVQASCC